MTWNCKAQVFKRNNHLMHSLVEYKAASRAYLTPDLVIVPLNVDSSILSESDDMGGMDVVELW